MIPQNVESTVPVPGIYLPPDDQVVLALVDFEDGGVAIQDPTQGLSGWTWKVFIVNLDVFVQRDGEAPVFQFSQDHVVELSLAFDQNMRPNVAYALDDGTIYLRWFDSVSHTYVTSAFGKAKNPRLTLDDKRLASVLTSDVILAYIRPDNALVYRQQRDRYGVEYVLQYGLLPDTKLKNVGMNNNYRLQFELA